MNQTRCTLALAVSILLAIGTAALAGPIPLVDITLSGGTHTESGLVTPHPNALRHTGYHVAPDGPMDLNGNGGMMAMTPFGTAELTNGPGNRGLDFDNDGDFTATGAIGQNDNYTNLFLGYFTAPTDGSYTFRNNGDDDRAGIWLDLDQDGTFESSTPGLGSNRGEQLSWEDGGGKTVDLTGGQRYLVGFTHGEWGGGSSTDMRVTTPALTERVVEPADAAQAGLWSWE